MCEGVKSEHASDGQSFGIARSKDTCDLCTLLLFCHHPEMCVGMHIISTQKNGAINIIDKALIV